jgi:hypothetical protein
MRQIKSFFSGCLPIFSKNSGFFSSYTNDYNHENTSRGAGGFGNTGKR